jgi:hypothetical protein
MRYMFRIYNVAIVELTLYEFCVLSNPFETTFNLH